MVSGSRFLKTCSLVWSLVVWFKFGQGSSNYGLKRWVSIHTLVTVSSEQFFSLRFCKFHLQHILFPLTCDLYSLSEWISLPWRLLLNAVVHYLPLTEHTTDAIVSNVEFVFSAHDGLATLIVNDSISFHWFFFFFFPPHLSVVALFVALIFESWLCDYEGEMWSDISAVQTVHASLVLGFYICFLIWVTKTEKEAPSKYVNTAWLFLPRSWLHCRLTVKGNLHVAYLMHSSCRID